MRSCSRSLQSRPVFQAKLETMTRARSQTGKSRHGACVEWSRLVVGSSEIWAGRQKRDGKRPKDAASNAKRGKSPTGTLGMPPDDAGSVEGVKESILHGLVGPHKSNMFLLQVTGCSG